MDGGAWWAAVYGVAQSQTRLKQLSSSSSRIILNIYNLLTVGSRLDLYLLYAFLCILHISQNSFTQTHDLHHPHS